MSHHQLFSPYDKRTLGQPLLEKAKPFLADVYAWFWGHEHRCVVMGDHMGIKARCIGHGAMPTIVPFGPPPFPDVPVVQVTLPVLEPSHLGELGRALAPLRDDGILLLGTGGLIHNLRRVSWDARDGDIESWALEAEAWFMERLEADRREELFRHRDLLPLSAQAAPTTEHLDPLFVALGAAHPEDQMTTVFRGFQMGNLSLRSLAWS